MSRRVNLSLTQHATWEYFTLGDLEAFVKKARRDLPRDTVLYFPMDSRLWSDSHGQVEALKLTVPEGSRNIDGATEAFIDIDFA